MARQNKASTKRFFRRKNISKNTYSPTGKCFDHSMEFLLNETGKRLKKTAELRKINLCHGILKKKDGSLYSHSWVVIDELYHSPFLDYQQNLCMISFSRREFFRTFNVLSWTTYTPGMVLYNNLRYGTFGPWLTEYKRLCSEYINTSKEPKIKKIKRTSQYQHLSLAVKNVGGI